MGLLGPEYQSCQGMSTLVLSLLRGHGDGTIISETFNDVWNA